jgi:hypothetical protein
LAKKALHRERPLRRYIKKGFVLEKKARFVVYNKPHVYIGTSIYTKELHFKWMYYTIVLEILLKLHGIWRAYGWPSLELKSNDEKHLNTIIYL